MTDTSSVAPWLLQVGDEAKMWAAEADEIRQRAENHYRAQRQGIQQALADVASWLEVRYGCNPVTLVDGQSELVVGNNEPTVVMSDGLRISLDRRYWLWRDAEIMHLEVRLLYYKPAFPNPGWPSVFVGIWPFRDPRGVCAWIVYSGERRH